MILIDSNVPTYLVGGDHPHKTDAQRWLERLTLDSRRLVSDAEVLQEILHRYTAISRLDAIHPAFDALLAAVDDFFPVTVHNVTSAPEILLASPTLSARNAIHVAVMRQHGVTEILSFDPAFDDIPGIRRIAG